MKHFPKDFLFGAATSSYQVEGAANEDGKGKSVWDQFAHTPGKIWNNQNADVSCDHYHRYPEDIALMKDLGIHAYRFSISWPRVIPAGTGAVNQKGLDFYSRLVDGLLQAGIQPWATLFHWDLPQALQNRSLGWLDRQCAFDFEQYALLMGKTLGDRVKNWFSINEFMCYTDKASLIQRDFAPEFNATEKQAADIRHHALLGNGLAVRALRSTVKNANIGIAENPACTVPMMDTPEYVEAAKKAFRQINIKYLVPVLEGAYDPKYLEKLGENAPTVFERDMDIIGTKLDFFGLNMYSPAWIEPEKKEGYRQVFPAADYPRAKPVWLRINPDIGYWATRFLKEIWGVKKIYISENGASFEDNPEQDGMVRDTGRIMYLRGHLNGVARAVKEGIPVKGYFYWTLLDNFEWIDGYNQRFGLIHVDYATQKRTPKLSFQYFRNVIKTRQVL
jgi:beta-glucosidase